MLPYIAERPLSLVRAPARHKGQPFFQKHDTGGFPDASRRSSIAETDGDDDKLPLHRRRSPASSAACR